MAPAKLIRTVLAGLITLGGAPLVASAQPLDKVTFGTNWVAEAEHGGFYQALADGTYKKYGLDVSILPGGPNANNRMLLLVDKKPDLVQRFVDASIIGWYNYIYGNNVAANALIKAQNPEMTDELLSYSVAKMKEYGIVDSGDALTLGVGAMTDARMKDFFDKMARAGVAQAGLDYRKSYTLRFVDKKVGLDLRPKQ